MHLVSRCWALVVAIVALSACATSSQPIVADDFVIQIDEERWYLVEGTRQLPVDEAALRERIDTAYRENSELAVLVQAAPNTPPGRVAAVLDILRDLGIREVAIAAVR